MKEGLKGGIFANNDVAYSKVSKKHAPRFILFQEFFLPTWPYYVYLFSDQIYLHVFFTYINDNKELPSPTRFDDNWKKYLTKSKIFLTYVPKFYDYDSV